MLLQVSEFRRRVDTGMDELVTELAEQTGRGGYAEKDAWKASFRAVRDAFSAPSFDELDLFFGSRGNLALEYRMPGGSGWADMVLLGRHETKPATVLIELKNWITQGDLPGIGEGLMERRSGMDQHPSAQVAGYVEWCQNFHSIVQDRGAGVHGCVLFTKDAYYHTYGLPPNEQLTRRYPCFSTAASDVKERLPEFFASRITKPDHDFAREFVNGSYRQNRSFVALVGEQILSVEKSPFVLLDGQRKAFDIVRARIEQALSQRQPKKTVIIVYGPPGSGKSAVAAKAWASLVSNPETARGNIVVTTTSASQNSNWKRLFQRAGGNRGAAGSVVAATGYSPIDTTAFGKLRDRFPTAFKDASEWRHNMDMLRSLIGELRSGSRDEEFLVSIVDEAHALINPEHVEGRGQHGFAVAFGPQAYHAMRCSRITVFLLDVNQGFRDQENTSISDLKRWASELGVERFDTISLEGCQFRCNGSKEYVDAIDEMFGSESPVLLQEHERRQVSYEVEAEPTLRAAEAPDKLEPRLKILQKKPHFAVEIYEGLPEMERRLRKQVEQGNNCRLLASYARKWRTKDVARPHALPPDLMDFDLSFQRGSNNDSWSRIWNFAPKADYTLFVQAPPGSMMNQDPLCEIGCPYVVRGFDFDYVGLLWLEDLVWRKDSWLVQPEHVHETGIKRLIGAARKESDPDGPAHKRLLKPVQQAYRILLTRAIKGLFIWCADDETQSHLRQCFNSEDGRDD